MNIDVTAVRKLKGHQSGVYQLLQRDERTLYSAGGDGWLVEWHHTLDWKEDGRILAKTDHPIFAACYAPENEYLFFGDFSGDFYRIEVGKHDQVRRIQFLHAPIYTMCIFRDSLWIGDKLGRISQWDLYSLDVLHQMRLANKSIRSIKPFGNLLLIGDSDGQLHMLEPADGTVQYQRLNAHNPSVFSLTSFETTIYSGGRDAQLKQWDSALEPLQSIPAHMSTINHLAVHPNLAILATASRDRSIRLWTLPSLKLVKVIDNKFDAHWHSVNHLIWWDNHHLISCSDDRTIAIWKIDINS